LRYLFAWLMQFLRGAIALSTRRSAAIPSNGSSHSNSVTTTSPSRRKTLGHFLGDSELATVGESIQAIAFELGLDENLVTAITRVESSATNWACRYEPGWRHFYQVQDFAVKLGQTFDTERMQQATSWGPMQVMGAVARELGFKQHLSMLAVPEIGVRYGCLKLQQLQKRYKTEEEVISSYNQGSPIKDPTGKLRNHLYVAKVQAELKKLRG
jgi:soluble lytic murein transglycosylase-like protein